MNSGTHTIDSKPSRRRGVARNLLGLVAALAIASVAGGAHGQAGKAAAKAAPATPGAVPAAGVPGTPDAAKGPGVKVERGAGGKKIYRITDEIKIEGKIQKPEAFYVLQKSGINYDWQELKQDFLPKILESVSKAPF